MDRRNALGALAAISLFPAGCCNLGPRVGPISWNGATPLAPPPRTSGAPVTIDAHAHFFNATDLTPEGYLKYSVAHGLEDKPELEKLVKAAAPYLGVIGRELPLTAAEEVKWLSSSGAGYSASDLRRERQRFLDQDLAPQIVKHLSKSEVQSRYLDARSRTKSLSTAYATRPVDLGSVESVSSFLTRTPDGMLKSLGARSGTLSESPEGDLEFIFRMLMPRWINLVDYMDACTTAPPGVDGAVSALVDFDDWMDDETACSPVADQIAVQELLARLSGGFTLPLAPFNPLKEPRESLDLVRDAIANRGFVGVKIYPPMGFGADGAHDIGPGDMKARMSDLFTLLESLNAVVMAHGNHSMGRSDAYEDFGGPDHWEAALANHPNLRVNIGHFGGTYDAWSARFAKDMATYPHLYGDLGYREELIVDDGQLRKLADLLKIDPASHRVMYGSDYFMMTRLDGWQGYAARMIQSLGKIADAQTLNRLRGQNAIECFGLLDTAPESNGGRLAQRRGNAPPPRWAQKA